MFLGKDWSGVVELSLKLDCPSIKIETPLLHHLTVFLAIEIPLNTLIFCVFSSLNLKEFHNESWEKGTHHIKRRSTRLRTDWFGVVELSLKFN
jgi:hypothetical protein